MLEQFNRSNIEILSDILGCDVTISCNLIAGNSINKNKIDEFLAYLSLKGINYINLPISRNINIKHLLFGLLSVFKLLKENQFNLIHCHTPIASALVRLAFFFLNKKGTKVIYTAHGFHFYKKSPIINWLVYYPIEKILSLKTDALITINKEDYNIAESQFYAKRNYYIRGVGVDFNKFRNYLNKKYSNLIEGLCAESNQKIITCIGELNDNKNQHLLIRAVKLLIDRGIGVCLLLIGIGANSEALKLLVRQLKLDDYVIFLGYRGDVHKILNITNLLVSVSKREGLGLTLIEAMASCVPIIATNNRGHRELIIDNYNGYLVSSNDYIDLSCKMEKILTCDKQRLLFVRRSNKIVKPFSKSNIDKVMIRIYMGLINYG